MFVDSKRDTAAVWCIIIRRIYPRQPGVFYTTLHPARGVFAVTLLYTDISSYERDARCILVALRRGSVAVLRFFTSDS